MRRRANTENLIIKKVHKQASKKISNGCKDVPYRPSSLTAVSSASLSTENHFR